MIIDPESREFQYTYDLAGRVSSVTLPDSRVISLTYDFNGNLISITPPGRSSHTFNYNGLSMMMSYNPPGLSLPVSNTTYAYNNDNKLTNIYRPDGQSINYSYDSYTGELTNIVFPSGMRSFSYSSGDLASTASEDGVYTSFSYNDGFLDYETLYSTYLGYNFIRSLNNRHLISDESLYIGYHNININFDYDSDGLLTQAGPLILTRSSANSFIEDIEAYDMKIQYGHSSAFGELSSIKATYNSSIDTYETSYLRDKLGRITTMTEKYQSGPTKTYNYIYDDAGRIVEVKEGSVTTHTYAYDSNSNRTSQTVS